MTTNQSPFVQAYGRYDGTASVTIQRTYELNVEQVKMLRRINENKGWIEFRNYRYDDATEERESRICYELVDTELLESDGMSWHLTFRLTEAGKLLMSQLL